MAAQAKIVPAFVPTGKPEINVTAACNENGQFHGNGITIHTIFWFIFTNPEDYGVPWIITFIAKRSTYNYQSNSGTKKKKTNIMLKL